MTNYQEFTLTVDFEYLAKTETGNKINNFTLTGTNTFNFF